MIIKRFYKFLTDNIEYLIIANIGLLFISIIEPSPSDIIFLLITILSLSKRNIIKTKIEKQKIFFLFIFSFLIISLFSFINASNLSLSFRYYAITLYLVTYSMIVFAYVDIKNIDIILKVYIIGATVASILGILGYIGIFQNILTFDIQRTKSLFKDPNVFGPYLIPSIALLIWNIKSNYLIKSISLTSTILLINIVGLILSFSRGAYISLIVTELIYFLLNIKSINFKKILMFIPTTLISSSLIWFFLLTSNLKEFLLERLSFQVYDSTRFLVQAKGISLSFKHLFGYGSGEFDNIMSIYFGEPIAAHSLYVRTLFENGVFGILFLSLFIFYILYNLFKGRIKEGNKIEGIYSLMFSIIVGICVNSLVIDSIHWRHLWLFIGLSLSLIHINIKENRYLPEDYEIEIISDIDSICKYEGEWNLILQENKNNNPFLEFNFLKLYWKHLSFNKELFILLIKKEDKLEGICPLMKEKGFLYNKISFIGKGYSCYMDFIIKNDYREEVITALNIYFENLKERYILNLFGIEDNSTNYPILVESLKHRIHFVKKLERRYISTKDLDFIHFYKERSSHNSIKCIKRKGVKLKKLGILSYEDLKGEDLEEIFYIQNKRWSKKLNGSTFGLEVSKEFFRELLLLDSFNPKSEIKSLKLNGNIIAFGYIFKCRDKYMFYRIGHDEKYSSFSPGILLTCILIEESFLQNYNLFDFGTGFERFKEEWTDKKDEVYTYIIPSSSYISIIYYCSFYLYYIIYVFLKKIKLLVIFKKKWLGLLLYYFSNFKKIIFKRNL